MKKLSLRTLLFIVVTTLFIVPFVLSDSSIWQYFGNDENNNIQYQAGNNEDILAIAHNITSGSQQQSFIADLDNDGNNEMFVFSTNKLTIYTSNFTYLDEIITSRNEYTIGGVSHAIYEVADINDSDAYKEIISVEVSTSNSSQIYFDIYSFDGSAVERIKSFRIDQAFSEISLMRCSEDFDGDNDLDCIFLARGSNKSFTSMMGFDINTNSPDTYSVNISYEIFGGVQKISFMPPPQIMDANLDGENDILMFTAAEFGVYNQSHVIFKDSTTGTIYNQIKDAMWYQTDTGSYEIIIATTLSGGWHFTYHGGVHLRAFDYNGNPLWNSSGNPDGQGYAGTCFYTGVTGTKANACEDVDINTYAFGGLAVKTIEQGDIYLWAGCYKGTGVQNSTVCRYNNNGVLQSEYKEMPIYPMFYNYTDMVSLVAPSYKPQRGLGAKFTLADMYAGANPEFISISGVVNNDAALLYSCHSQKDGWCLPVDYDSDSLLELVCSDTSLTTIYDEEAAGGGSENQRPDVYFLQVSNHYPVIDEVLDIKVYADDPEDSTIWYAVDCQYDDETDESVSMANYEGIDYSYAQDDSEFKTCTYTENGTYTIKAWATDSANGGTGDLLSNMDSLTKTIYIGDVDVLCLDHYLFCDDFNYQSPIINNKWIIENGYDVFDTSLAPSSGKLAVENETWYIFHHFPRHKARIMSLFFELEIDYHTGYDEFNAIVYSSATNDQVILSFIENRIYASSGSNQYNYVGSYTNNTNHNYTVIIYYEDIIGLGNTTYKGANTYEVLQDDQRIAEDLIFYHGFDGSIEINNTDQTFYSDGLQFKFNYNRDNLDMILDNVKIMEGTSHEYNNINDYILDMVGVQDYDDIIKYMGCYILNGENAGEFDCYKTDLDCMDCCGYKDGKLQVVSVTCASGKILLKSVNQVLEFFWKFFVATVIIGFIVLIIWTLKTRRSN